MTVVIRVPPPIRYEYVMDRLAGSTWTAAATVEAFARSSPNPTLMAYADMRRASGATRLLDIGCGAGRNAVPLARGGWQVLGVDLSAPMLSAARERARGERLDGRLELALAPMDRLPVPSRSVDLIVAHGVWNLAQSGCEFRTAVKETARVAKPGAGLFLFTFSRSTLPESAGPVPGETFVFTQFAGRPQCFLTEMQLRDELAAAGFVPDPAVPLTEYNRQRPGFCLAGGPPAIYECGFRFLGPPDAEYSPVRVKSPVDDR